MHSSSSSPAPGDEATVSVPNEVERDQASRRTIALFSTILNGEDDEAASPLDDVEEREVEDDQLVLNRGDRERSPRRTVRFEDPDEKAQLPFSAGTGTGDDSTGRYHKPRLSLSPSGAQKRKKTNVDRFVQVLDEAAGKDFCSLTAPFNLRELSGDGYMSTREMDRMFSKLDLAVSLECCAGVEFAVIDDILSQEHEEDGKVRWEALAGNKDVETVEERQLVLAIKVIECFAEFLGRVTGSCK